MSDYRVRLLKFKDDGLIPNNSLPVIVYTQIADTQNKSEWFEQRFILNGWTNNWRDIVLSYDHFHSNTHEVLGIGKGQVTLQIGGNNGIRLTVRAGDALIIPAGVGHYSIPQKESYEVVGGYPNGTSWDMCTGAEDDRNEILQRIRNISLPTTDPIYGKNGELLKSWTAQ